MLNPFALRRQPSPANTTAPATLGVDPEDRGALISDADLERLALAEEAFRAQWARELGLDPETADLDALPPVEPAAAPARRAV